MGEKVVDIRGLRKVYSNGVEAVKGINLSIEKQQVHALLGPNGAGKTTTIKSILGFVNYEGEIRILNKKIDDVRDKISFVPEEKSFYTYLTPRKAVNMCVRLLNNFDKDQAFKLLEYFDIPIDKKIKSFSNGMKTSTYISLALAQDADIYIFDEPTIGLDPIKRTDLLELIRQKVIDGKTVLYTSHIIPEVEKIADYISIMYKGRILYSGYRDDIKERFRVVYMPIEKFREIEEKESEFFAKTTDKDAAILLVENPKRWEEFQHIEDVEIKSVELEDFFNILIRGNEDAL